MIVPLSYCLASREWMLLPCVLVAGVIGAGTELSYFNGVLHFAPVDKIPQYQAIFSISMGIRGLIAPYVGTVLIEKFGVSMKTVFLISAVMIVASVIVQIMGMRKYKALTGPHLA